MARRASCDWRFFVMLSIGADLPRIHPLTRLSRHRTCSIGPAAWAVVGHLSPEGWTRYNLGMKMNAYQQAALRTAAPRDKHNELFHLLLGLVGETGEIAEK